MKTFRWAATYVWLLYAWAVACFGVTGRVAAQPAGASATCSSYAFDEALKSRRMPNAVGCSSMLVSQAFVEMQAPLRIDWGSGALQISTFPTSLKTVPDRPVVSQHPFPGTSVAGGIAEISLVTATKTPATNPQKKAAPLVLQITPAQAVAGKPLLFQVSIQPAPNQAATYQAIYWVQPGTANPGSDFTATQGVVTLTPGVTATLRVETRSDPDAGSDRTLTMNIKIVGAAYTSSQGTIIAAPIPPPTPVAPPVPPPVPVPAPTILYPQSHSTPVSFAISPVALTLPEGGTIKVTVSRSGTARSNQAIGVIFTDRASCAGPPDRRTLVFARGQQRVAISKVICRDAAVDASRFVSIKLVSPPRNGTITAGETTVKVTQGSSLLGWVIIASGLGAVVAAVAFAVSRLRFRRRWRKALPEPFPVSALCAIGSAVSTATARVSAGPAIRIDVSVVFDTPTVERQPKEAR